mgnify:FL=1|tara:strand:+ start:403 stop:636 length:234 start_codon:yes stop_codon:yes gene_type:complete
MAISKKKKPTNKDMIRTINSLGMEIQMVRMEVENAKKVQDMYIHFKKDEKKFLEWMKKELKLDDKPNGDDTEKTEDK